MRILNYLKNVYLSHCCEQGWRAYMRWDDGEWMRADPGKKTEGPHYNAFIADPFLFHYQGTNWLFYETVGPERVASGLKGKIGCFKEVDGKWVNQGIVLEQPWHLSYPQVFEEDGHVYMIPEQSDLGRGTVSLYEATDFPRGWVKRATLIDRPFADATLLLRDGHYYLACYTIPPHESAELWHAPSLLGPWTQHPQSQNIHQEAKYRRCGGAFIEEKRGRDVPAASKEVEDDLILTRRGRRVHGGELPQEDSQLYRVAQDCDGGYGFRLYKVPVLAISPTTYREGAPELLLSEAMIIPQWKHTFNEIHVGEHKLSVFDCQWRTRLPFSAVLKGLSRRVGMKVFR